MSRIEWSRYGGDEIEALVSMFVCREIPNAFRIRPSQGDGGIDVCVPITADHVEIYQVKKFAANLSDGQRTQIANSHKRIQEYAKDRGWTIDRWHLTLPLEPTPENTEWFDELEKTADFPCEWKGLSTIEGWVSAHPDIVDYYLNNWNDRVIEEVARFVRMSGIPMAVGTPEENAEGFANLSPDDAQQKLTALRATLNMHDPHFTYDFAVTEAPISNPIDYSREPLPVAVTTQPIGDSYVTYWVYPRCVESLHERPITVRASVVTATGSPEHKEMENFVKYGRTPTRPLRVEKVEAQLPGGLGGTVTEAKMIMGDAPDRSEGGFERRVSILTPDGEELVSLDVTIGSPSRNHDNTGMSNRGSDSTGVLELETLTNVSSDGKLEMQIVVHRGDPTGFYPDEIEPALAFVHHFTAPNTFRIAPIRGAREGVDQLIPETGVDRSADAVRWNEFLLRYVRALIVVQAAVSDEIKMPDLTTEENEDVLQVLRAARLLKGETIERKWETIPLTLDSSVTLPEPEGGVPIAFDQELSISIGGRNYGLGVTHVVADAAKIGTSSPNDDGTVNTLLIPALSDAMASFTWRG